MNARTVFIDCNDQLRPVFDAVSRPDDPQIAVNREPFTSEDLPRLLDGCDICIVDHSYMPTDIVARCADLRHIVFLGTGPQSYMDIEALRRRGVTVHAIKGYGDTAVAEHAVALMFACARDLARMDRDIRAGTWRPREGVQLRGKKLGIIGLGGIGAILPQNRRATLGADDGIIRVLHDQNAIRDADAQCAAGTAFADDGRDDGNFE